MFEIAIGLFVIGFLLSIIAGIAYLVAGFKVSPWWGICMLFVPFASLIFFFVHFKKAWRPVGLSLLGTLMIPASIFVAPRDAAFDEKLAKYAPDLAEQGITAETIPSFPALVELVKQIDVEEFKAAAVSGSPLAMGDGAEGGAAEQGAQTTEIGGKKFPVFSFDPSEPLDPDQVKVNVIQRAPEATVGDPATGEGISPVINVAPSIDLNKRLVGKPESVVSDELGKPLGVGKNRGNVFWMYSDFIVSFDRANRVASVEFDNVD